MDFLCLDFVNSSWYITHKQFADPLEDYEWLKRLLIKWDMDILPSPDKLTLDKLKKMRVELSCILTALSSGNALKTGEISMLNSYMAAPSFYRQLESGNEGSKLKEIPAIRDWSWFMSRTAASLAQLSLDDSLRKLKACENPECNWFFIDESKGGSRKWCDDSCGSLMKVRRFRQKQKNAPLP